MLMNFGKFFKALGFFSSGVTVITGRRPWAASAGVTVNGFVSVSPHPPLILFGLTKISGCFSAFGDGGRFAGPWVLKFKNPGGIPILPCTRNAQGRGEYA